MATIQGIYIALFGRPADPLGLAFWNSVTNNGADLTKLINGDPSIGLGPLAGEPEYTNRFIGQTNAQIVNSIFVSLFGHDADPVGLAFYTNLLASGQAKIADIAIRIYDGAQNADLATLQNKEAAANLFTAEIDTTQEILAYNENTADIARDYLTPITSNPATVPTEAQAEAAVQALVDAGQTGVDKDFTPVIGETLTGTDLADTFNGVLNDDAGTSTYANGIDSADGGLGDDTMNLLVVDANGQIVLNGTSIEHLIVTNLDGTDATFNLLGMPDVTAITSLNSSEGMNFDQVQQIVTEVNIITPTGTNEDLDITLAAGVVATPGTTPVEVVVTIDSTDGWQLDYDQGGTDVVTGYTIHAEGDNDDFELDDLTVLTDLTVDGSGSVDFDLQTGTPFLATIDAANLVGDLSFDDQIGLGVAMTFNGSQGDTTVPGGFDTNGFDLTATTQDGDDNLGIIHMDNAGTAIVSMGGGNDNVDFDATTDATVTAALGEGNNTSDLTLAGNVALTLTSGTGSDTITVAGAIGAAVLNISTGAGDDSVTLNAGALGTDEVLNGGEGGETVGDTLTVDADDIDSAGLNPLELGGVTNFENLVMNGGAAAAIDFSAAVVGFNNITVVDNTGFDITIDDLGPNAVFTLGTSQTGDISLDAVGLQSLTINSGLDGNAGVTFQDLTLSDFSSVTFNYGGGGSLDFTGDFVAPDVTTITFVDNNGGPDTHLHIDWSNAGDDLSGLQTVDFSGALGHLHGVLMDDDGGDLNIIFGDLFSGLNDVTLEASNNTRDTLTFNNVTTNTDITIREFDGDFNAADRDILDFTALDVNPVTDLNITIGAGAGTDSTVVVTDQEGQTITITLVGVNDTDNGGTSAANLLGFNILT